MEHKNEIKVKITDQHHFIEQFRTFIYSGDLKILYFLMVLMVLDVITGLAKALKNGNLWSRKSMYGIARKMLIFCIIILANIIDQILNLHGGLLIITIIYYIANECLSIIENCAEMGVGVPPQIVEKLKVMKDNNDKKD